MTRAVKRACGSGVCLLLSLLLSRAAGGPDGTGEAQLAPGEPVPAVAVPRLGPNQVAVARLRLREDTLRVDPMSDINLIAAVRERLGWSHIYPERIVVGLNSDLIFRFPFLIFVSEHHPMNLSRREKERLRQFLARGGFLFASECDAKLRLRPSIRSELLTVVPEGRWIRIPSDHILYQVPFPIAIVPAGRGGQRYHEGVEINGRLCLVFSQNAEECSWQSWKWLGPRCACAPPDFDYAFSFGANLLYYALTH